MSQKKTPHFLNRVDKSETSFAKKAANLQGYLDFLQKMGVFFLWQQMGGFLLWHPVYCIISSYRERSKYTTVFRPHVCPVSIKSEAKTLPSSNRTPNREKLEMFCLKTREISCKKAVRKRMLVGRHFSFLTAFYHCFFCVFRHCFGCSSLEGF